MNQIAFGLAAASCLAVGFGLFLATRLVLVARIDLKRIRAQRVVGVINVRLMSVALFRALYAGMHIRDVALVTIISVLSWGVLGDERCVTRLPHLNDVYWMFVIGCSGMTAWIRHKFLFGMWIKTSERLCLRARTVPLKKRCFLNRNCLKLIFDSTSFAFTILAVFFGLQYLYIYGDSIDDKDSHRQKLLALILVTFYFSVLLSSVFFLIVVLLIRRICVELQGNLQEHTGSDVEVSHYLRVVTTRFASYINRPLSDILHVEGANKSPTADADSPPRTLTLRLLFIAGSAVFTIYWDRGLVFFLLLQHHLGTEPSYLRFTTLWLYGISNCFWAYVMHACFPLHVVSSLSIDHSNV